MSNSPANASRNNISQPVWEVDKLFEKDGRVVTVSRRKMIPNQFSVSIGVRVGERVMNYFPVYVNRKNGRVTFNSMNMTSITELMTEAEEYILVEAQAEEDKKSEKATEKEILEMAAKKKGR